MTNPLTVLRGALARRWCEKWCERGDCRSVGIGMTRGTADLKTWDWNWYDDGACDQSIGSKDAPSFATAAHAWLALKAAIQEASK